MKLPTFENPLKLFTPAFAGATSGAMGTNGGHMMFASSGSGSGGGSGYDDDDDGFYDDEYNPDDDAPQEEPPARRPQSNRTRRSSAGRANASGGRSRTAGVGPEERYWTDYLRIALPVIGIILMLGLLWIWASNLLGDDSDVDDPAEDTIGLVQTETPDPNAVNTEPNAGSTPAAPPQETNTGEIPISGDTGETTPPPSSGTFNPLVPDDTAPGGDNQADDEGETGEGEAPPADDAVIAVDSRVQITDPVNVRPSAGTTGDPLWVADPGDQGVVSSGPEEADEYVWWEIVFDNGSAGFVAEDFLELVP